MRGPRISPGSRPRRRRSPRSNTPTSSRSSRSASTTACPISRSNSSPAAASRQKIGGKPQPVDEAARIVEVLARAMDVAHQHKVIHRDLKPANVLLAADGTVKISRLRAGEAAGERLGTDAQRLDPGHAELHGSRTGDGREPDGWARRRPVCLGRNPLRAARPAARRSRERRSSIPSTWSATGSRCPRRSSSPRRPATWRRSVSSAWQKRLARRYPDVLALAEDLRRFRAGETILARPVSGPERLWRWCLRNPRVASLSAAVALLLVIVAAGSAIAAVTVSGQNQALGKANKLAEEKRFEAERKQKLAVAAAGGQRTKPKCRGCPGRSDRAPGA